MVSLTPAFHTRVEPVSGSHQTPQISLTFQKWFVHFSRATQDD